MCESVRGGEIASHASRLTLFDPPTRVQVAVRPEGEGRITAQGHPRAIFNRAIERGNLLVAETTACEIGRVPLVELIGMIERSP